MGKKVINSTVDSVTKEDTDKLVKEINTLSTDSIFTPTPAMVKLKASFWTKYRPGPFDSPNDSVTLDKVLQIVKGSGAKRFWSKPGFIEWFNNKDEERERIKYLFQKSLDTAENILDNPEANANAKVNIIKMLAEMNGHLGKRPEPKYLDEDINRMSESQLKDFLTRKGVKITEEKVLEITNKEESGEDDRKEEN